MRDHTAITHCTERAQTLPVGSIHFGHSEVAEVALSEQQIFPPQGSTVRVEEHLECIKNKDIRKVFFLNFPSHMSLCLKKTMQHL